MSSQTGFPFITTDPPGLDRLSPADRVGPQTSEASHFGSLPFTWIRGDETIKATSKPTNAKKGAAIAPVSENPPSRNRNLLCPCEDWTQQITSAHQHSRALTVPTAKANARQNRAAYGQNKGVGTQKKQKSCSQLPDITARC